MREDHGCSRYLRNAHTVRGAALGFAVLLAAASTVVVVADEKSRLTEEVGESRAEFLKKDASLGKELAAAAGYALFPSVGKGGIGIGGAHGTGQVIVGGSPVAKTTLTQVDVGFQLGGQKYAELILFENKEALDHFLTGAFTMAARRARSPSPLARRRMRSTRAASR